MKNPKLSLMSLMAVIVMIYSCEKQSSGDIASGSAGSNTGTGGSMAKYTIMNNYLYTVENFNLKIYDVTVASNPKYLKKVALQSNVSGRSEIETIFANDDYLFFGTMSGMLIYSIANPVEPSFISKYEHVISCDPVVVDSKYAYVTLSKSSTCQRGINALEIIDISNISSPKLLQSYSFTNPKGMALDDGYLYLCDGDAGLKVIDITKAPNISVVGKIDAISTFDAIVKDDILTITGKDGLYQYDCTNPLDLKFISKINK